MYLIFLIIFVDKYATKPNVQNAGPVISDYLPNVLDDDDKDIMKKPSSQTKPTSIYQIAHSKRPIGAFFCFIL